jgi:hypothetical protein
MKTGQPGVPSEEEWLVGGSDGAGLGSGKFRELLVSDIRYIFLQYYVHIKMYYKFRELLVSDMRYNFFSNIIYHT